MAANGTLGAFETFAGRLVEGAVQVLSGQPQQPHQVSDTAMAAHAAVNMAMGLIAGARAGVHTWRATGNCEAYWRGFRGERSAPSAALAMAGTPNVPASQLPRLLASVAVAVGTFGLAAHTGVNALLHLRSSSQGKVDAHEAVVQSNANTAYCYTREAVNLLAHAFQVVSHDALLTWPGCAASSAEYGFNSAAQQAVLSDSNLSEQARPFDLRWPAFSAAAEAVDVALTSASARLAEPDRPVTIWRGRLAERISAEENPPSRLTVIDAIDRVTQRAVGRQLVGELSKVVPPEFHWPSWTGPTLAAGTHVRELAWQAERASRGGGASTAPSDPEAPPPVGASPNAGGSGSPTLPQDSTELFSLGDLNAPPLDLAGTSSSAEAALPQEGTELPSPGDLNASPPDVAGPSSSAETASSFVDRSLEEFGHLVGLGWEHRRARAPQLLIDALNRRGDLSRTPHQTTNFRIHGQIYTTYLEPGTGVPAIDNPLSGNIMIAPVLGLDAHGSAGGRIGRQNLRHCITGPR
ncbi:hypothetical protein [Bradyrhizobium sp. USDA 3315]